MRQGQGEGDRRVPSSAPTHRGWGGVVYIPVVQQLWDRGRTGHTCQFHTLFRLIVKKQTHFQAMKTLKRNQ